jgi:hypothetical protein
VLISPTVPLRYCCFLRFLYAGITLETVASKIWQVYQFPFLSYGLSLNNH